MKTLVTVMILSASLFAGFGPSEGIFSIGPVFHWNIGGGDTRFSMGIEGSYWQIDGFSESGNVPPIGFDAGIEYQPYDDVTRIYSEVQVSLLYGGLSIGPGIEFKDESTTGFAQCSIWAGFLAYADLRVRKTYDETYLCPGVMAKCPFWVENGGISTFFTY